MPFTEEERKNNDYMNRYERCLKILEERGWELDGCLLLAPYPNRLAYSFSDACKKENL